jgi:hypothetical protein
MANIDWEHRWVYKGSKTIPPCERYVYWNVIESIYPIDQHTVDLFKAKLEEGGIHAVGDAGNYRSIQKGFNPDVGYVKSGALQILASSLTILASTSTSTEKGDTSFLTFLFSFYKINTIFLL